MIIAKYRVASARTMMVLLIAITPSLNAPSRLELEIVKKKVVQKRIGGFALLRNRQNVDTPREKLSYG